MRATATGAERAGGSARAPAQGIWRAACEAFLRPVHPENRANLARLWAALPDALRDERQMLGRQVEGCGATVGVEPRCDFACGGCYLGAEANRIPPASIAEVDAQMARLRRRLGRFGNLQLTDGEVTLRDERELVELLRRAQAHELIPMLMTHGDAFRRRPGLLERLVVEGGLRELSLHVDTTQRGRRGAGWDRATREEELDPLRDELVELVRDVGRRTGIVLRVATTVSVSAANLDGVAGVMRWARRHADLLRIVSFQPLAQVGRTEPGLGGAVDVDELWRRIAEGLLDDRARADELEDARLWFGHPGCSRVVMGVVAERGRERAVYHPLRTFADRGEADAWRAFYGRWGGISFRADRSLEAAARALGVLVRSLDLLARYGPRLARTWLARLDPEHPLRSAAELALGRVRLRGLAVVSHHFMSSPELATPLGRERTASCVFHAVHDGELVSMCELNALGLRAEQYARLAARERPMPRPAPALEEIAP